MKIEDLLALIPDEDLAFLSAETKVDHQVKKLTGITIFKLILFSMLNTNKISLRVMEEFLNTATFKSISGMNKGAKFNSIGDRISNINVDFFEKIYSSLFDKLNTLLAEKSAIVKVDTTYVAISAKLVDWSLRKGGQNKDLRHLKLGLGFKGSLPCHVKIFTNQNESSDDIAIPETVLSSTVIGKSIVTFDRGVQSRKALTNLSGNNVKYVGRLNLNSNRKVISENALSGQDEGTILIRRDYNCRLKDRKQTWTEETFRVIEATINKTNEEILFITNITDMSALEIATIYKQRWEIEVFIKFLKQHLNLTHIMSRSENGIKVVLYMTMILAMLIIVFKKINRISSTKIAKLRLEIELDNTLIKEIVILCGGNPDNAQHLWNST